MLYETKNYDHLLGIVGLSDELLKNHFTLYAGYVANVNKLADILRVQIEAGEAGKPEHSEMKRRFGWEWNGMRLHELYFENIAKGTAALDAESALYKKIEEDFGTFANWETEFRAIGAMRGIGWAVLAYDAAGKRLFNVWINEHDAGHLAGATPILIMDVFEHAFMLDYGIKRADYIDAFFRVIDWTTVSERFHN